jgi:uncharacterized membrane protein
MRIVSVGHGLFAATILLLGIWGLVEGQLASIWQPVPKDAALREALAYGCVLVCLASGAGMLWRRTAAPAARLLLAALLLWFAAFRLPEIWRSHASIGGLEGPAETAVMVAGAWALYAQFADDWDRRRLGFATGDKGVRIARILYGLAMIVFGLAHFAFLKLTASLVPAWLPAHTAWAQGTGAAYIAAGVAVLTGVLGRLAARLSVLQMGVFTLLVWAPIVMAGSKNAFDWSEASLSWTLTTAGWVLADTYRAKAGMGGLALRFLRRM